MAPAQLALPVERRNGVSPRRAVPVVEAPPAHAPPVEVPPAVEVGDQAVNVEAPPVEAGDQAVEVAEGPDVAAVPVWVQRVTTAAVLSVALVAAIASYEHMRALADLAGEGWRSWLLPLSVDGLAVAASMTMLVRRGPGCPPGRWRGWPCCWGWVRRWRRTWRRRNRPCRAGWWRRGPRWGSCCPTSC